MKISKILSLGATIVLLWFVYGETGLATFMLLCLLIVVSVLQDMSLNILNKIIRHLAGLD